VGRGPKRTHAFEDIAIASNVGGIIAIPGSSHAVLALKDDLAIVRLGAMRHSPSPA